MQVRDSRVRRGWKRAVIGTVGVLALVCVQAASAQTPRALFEVGEFKELKNRLRVTGGKIEVVAEGIVDNHVDTPDSANVAGYYFKDVKGDRLLVRTTQTLPSPAVRVRVTGVAMIDREGAFKSTPYIVEMQRAIVKVRPQIEFNQGVSELNPVQPFPEASAGAKTLMYVPAGGAATSGPQSATSPSTPASEIAATSQTSTSAATQAGTTVATSAATSTSATTSKGVLAYFQAMQPGTIGLFAVLGVGLIVGAFVLLSRRKPAAATEPWQNPYLSTPPPAVSDPADVLRPSVSAAAPAPSANGHQSAVTFEEYKTVKAYKTTKVLPGRLVVLDGGRETDVIHLSDQNGRGEIEIGRDAPDVSGGIRVKDKTNTLSRRQGKLIYDAAKREFTYLNLVGDEGNATVYNGRALRQNEAVVLSSRDVLAMGNVELMFAAK